MTQDPKSSIGVRFQLDEYCNELGMESIDTETNGAFGERIIAELENWIAELRTTQAQVRDLIKDEN